MLPGIVALTISVLAMLAAGGLWVRLEKHETEQEHPMPSMADSVETGCSHSTLG